MDINLDRLRYLADVMPANVTTVDADDHAIRHRLQRADPVIGAVLIPAVRTPTLLRRREKKKKRRAETARRRAPCLSTS